MERRAVAQEADAEFLHQVEILAPASRNGRILHLVHPEAAAAMVGSLFSMPVANMKNGLPDAWRWGILNRECKDWGILKTHNAQCTMDEPRAAAAFIRAAHLRLQGRGVAN